MRNIPKIIFFVALLISASDSFAQNAPNSASMSFRINKVADIYADEVITNSKGINAWTFKNGNRITIRIFYFNSPNFWNSSDEEEASVTVPLKIRSNAPYEILAFQENQSDEENSQSKLKLTVASLDRPVSRMIAPGSDDVETDFRESPSSFFGRFVKYNKPRNSLDANLKRVISGSRISLGGDNYSIGNFVMADLKFTINPTTERVGYYFETINLIVETP